MRKHAADKALTEVAFRQLNTLFVDSAEGNPTADVAALATLAGFGYACDMSTDLAGIGTTVAELMPVLEDSKGAYSNHAALFSGFPNSLPDADDLNFRAIQYLIEDVLGIDIAPVGWWPRSSIPVDAEVRDQAMAVQRRLPVDSHTVWNIIKVAPERELVGQLGDWTNKTLANAKSLRPDQVADISTCLSSLTSLKINAEDISFRENKALVAAHYFRNDNVKALMGMMLSPTDVLRMLALYNGAEDASLNKPMGKVKLNRAQWRTVFALANQTASKDRFFEYRGLWLQLARSGRLYEYKSRFQNLHVGITMLREETRNHTSENSKIEYDLKKKNVASIIGYISNGNFMRRLLNLLSVADDKGTALVVQHLERVVTDLNTVDTVVLAALINSLIDSEEGSTPGVTFNQAGKALEFSNDYDISLKTLMQVRGVLQDNLWAKMPIDNISSVGMKDIRKIILPTQQRTASNGLWNFERGSVVPTSQATDTLRMFIHWVEPADSRSDLDLSVVTYDKNLRPLGQVSYTNLASSGIVHSGDLTSAPGPSGAAEFIDITLSKLPKNVAYVGPSIFNYSGPNFSQLDTAVAGWAWREGSSSDYKTFDPSTVENKVDLTNESRTWLPFLYDVVDGSVIVCDYALDSGGWGQRVEKEITDITRILKAIKNLHVHRPTIGSVVDAYVIANNAVYKNPTHAERVFDLNNMDEVLDMIGL